MSSRIDFPGQYQILSQWCWLACASGIADYYLGRPDARAYTQCRLALQVGLRPACCVQRIHGAWTRIDRWMPEIGVCGRCALNLPSARCNSPGNPATALRGTRRLTARWNGPAHDPAWMEGELDRRRPVLGHITWKNGGGHIVVFYGVEPGRQPPLYNVSNPWTGDEVWVGGDVPGGRWDYSASARPRRAG